MFLDCQNWIWFLDCFTFKEIGLMVESNTSKLTYLNNPVIDSDIFYIKNNVVNIII